MKISTNKQEPECKRESNLNFGKVSWVKQNRVPPQNIVIRLFERSINRRHKTHYQSYRNFYQVITPNFTVCHVKKPFCFIRKFSPCGRFLVAFSADQTSVEIYEYQGATAANELLYCCPIPPGDTVLHSNEPTVNHVLNNIFERFFKLRFSVHVAGHLEQLNRECSLFTSDGKHVIVASASSREIPAGIRPGDTYRNNESVTPNPRSPLDDYTVTVIDLESGVVCDTVRYKHDKIFLAHNQGLSLFGNTLMVLSVQHQTMHRYHVSEEGKLLFIQSIGRVCYPDDEVLINACIAHDCPNLRQQEEGSIGRRDDQRPSGAGAQRSVPHRGRRGLGNRGNRPRGTGWSSDVLRHLEEILSADGDGGASSSGNGRGGGSSGSLSGEALTTQQQRAAQNAPSVMYRDMPLQQRQLLQERQRLQRSRINLDWLNPSSGHPFFHSATSTPSVRSSTRNSAPTSFTPRAPNTSSTSRADSHRTASVSRDSHYGGPPSPASAAAPPRSAASSSNIFSSSLFSGVSGAGSGSWTPGSGGGGPSLMPASSVVGQGGPSSASLGLPAMPRHPIFSTPAAHPLPPRPAPRLPARHDHSQGPDIIYSLKHRLLVFLLRVSQAQGEIMSSIEPTRQFFASFDTFLHLRIVKMQLLDEHHLLLKYGSEDVATLRTSEPAIQQSYFVVYNMDTTEVVAIYENTSKDMLAIYERFTEYFRNPRLQCEPHYYSSPSNNFHARELYERHKTTLITSRGGSVVEATKRILSQLPVACQAFSPSPYLDLGLYSYQDKCVSAIERPKTAAEHPIRFYGRESGLLKFCLEAGGRLLFPPPHRHLVAFTFHPYDPFAISVQKRLDDYIVSFHVRHHPT